MAEPGPVRRLGGKVAAVTGGGAGIGRAICRRLADEGALVAVLDINPSAAEETVALLGAGAAVRVDVSDSDSVSAAVETVESELGPLAIMVNNAGAVGIEHIRRVNPLLGKQREEAAQGRVTTALKALELMRDDEWRRMLAIHLDGTFFCTRAAARVMAPRKVGSIVNMSSVCGIHGCTGHPHYSAAKAGILGFTRAAAKELIVEGIRLNVIAPGFVGTDTGDSSLDANRAAMAASTPAGRLATPEEIAATVAFLASDDAGYFVGATLSPNGGLLTAG